MGSTNDNGTPASDACRNRCSAEGYDWTAPCRAADQAAVIVARIAARAEGARECFTGEDVSEAPRIRAALDGVATMAMLAREFETARENGHYDPRRLECDDRVEANLAGAAVVAALSGVRLVDDELTRAFGALLRAYAWSPSWPAAPTWELAAKMHMCRLAIARLDVDDWAIADWKASARRVADIIGTARAWNVLTYGHPDERVSMAQRRTRGHRLAAFLSDEEWPRVRKALGAMGTSAYRVEWITIDSVQAEEVAAGLAERLGADPLLAETLGLGCSSSEMTNARAAQWLARGIGFRASHGIPTANARALIGEGLEHAPTIAAMSGANEKVVRELLSGKRK